MRRDSCNLEPILLTFYAGTIVILIFANDSIIDEKLENRFKLQNMFSAIVTIMMCCSGPLSLLKAQGLLLMSLVVIVVNLINLVCIL